MKTKALLWGTIVGVAMVVVGRMCLGFGRGSRLLFLVGRELLSWRACHNAPHLKALWNDHGNALPIIHH